MAAVRNYCRTRDQHSFSEASSDRLANELEPKDVLQEAHKRMTLKTQNRNLFAAMCVLLFARCSVATAFLHFAAPHAATSGLSAGHTAWTGFPGTGRLSAGSDSTNKMCKES